MLWKVVSSAVGYEVSSTGLVRNAKTKRLISVFFDHAGYAKVTIRTYKKKAGKFVHRLVAEAFIPNPLNKKEVNHKDGNRGNFSIENLEWCSRSENMQDSRLRGLRTRKDRSIKLNHTQIHEIRNLHGTISNRNIAKIYKVSHTQINHIINGKCWGYLK